MAFLKNVKAALTRNYKDLFEATRATETEVFTSNMRRFPGADPNAWLAMTLRARPEFSGRPENWYFTSTADLSVLEPITKAPLPLTIQIFWETLSGIDREMPELQEMYTTIMNPVLHLQYTGGFYVRWCSVNPWTLNNVVGIADEVRALGEQGRGQPGYRTQ